ncbi:MAG: NADH-quinone oxidoreductase subunit J [Chitinophagales bacterium]|nr:NADH-quinone oxidoreductase subunit J [Chitinophagales bacterium]
MNIIFYIAALIALIATFRVVTHKNAVHALLYLVVSLLAISVIFFISGAPFVAALEVIVYAGAIMVLFVFAIVMLNLGEDSIQREANLLQPGVWKIPTILIVILLAELIYVFASNQMTAGNVRIVDAAEVSQRLFGGYVLAVEMTGMYFVRYCGCLPFRPREEARVSPLFTNKRRRT